MRISIKELVEMERQASVLTIPEEDLEILMLEDEEGSWEDDSGNLWRVVVVRLVSEEEVVIEDLERVIGNWMRKR